MSAENILPGSSPYLYGSHEPPPPDVMPDGWILFLEAVGHSSEPYPTRDYGQWANAGYGIICRVQHGWDGAGTFPRPENLDGYVSRVASLVSNSRYCHRWVIGNEPNLQWERPDGWLITPEYAALCYNRCWTAIHDLAGHEFDEVIVPPIGPWNIDAGIGWVEYFTRMLAACEFVDALAVHAYTHGSDPALITSEAKMDPPYQDAHYNFRVYRDWLGAVPADLRNAPVYMTETDQNQPWLNERNGWIPEMYREIDDWNQSGNQIVRCACLYRWPKYDPYAIEGKTNVIADWQVAQARRYTWIDEPEPPKEEEMLLNPSFEGAWYNQTPDGILVLPESWRAEYLEGANPWFRPEIKPNTEYKTDGTYSIRAFAPASSRTNFGICQELDAVAGQWYKFSADVRLESNPPGELTGSVGIQPWGGGIFERAMIWGEETRITLEWTRVEVIARAYGGRIRVAMGATNKYATKNNTTWWDNAKLELWECDGGTTPPEPPEPGECNALTYAQTVAAVQEAMRGVSWGITS